MTTVIHIAKSYALTTSSQQIAMAGGDDAETPREETAVTPAHGARNDATDSAQEDGFPELRYLPAGHRCRKRA